MGRPQSPTTLRRESIQAIRRAIALAEESGDYRKMLQAASWLAKVANQIERGKQAKQKDLKLAAKAKKDAGVKLG